jgi:integrase
MRITLKHVKAFKAKGRVYYYHRLTGERLRAEPGTPQFIAEVERETARAKRRDAALRGTLGALMQAYQGSPEFGTLADATRADYRRVMDWLACGARDVPLHVIDTPFVMELRDLAFKQHKRRFANYVLQVLSRVFNWGMPRGHSTSNPAAAAEKVRRPKSARVVNRVWKSAELRTVLDAASPDLRVAIALGAYAGLREADAIGITWAGYDGHAIEARQEKTGEPLWIPVHRDLKSILDEWRERGRGSVTPAVTIVTGARGKPYEGTDGFRANFFKLIRRLKVDGKVAPGLTFHGLRHTAGTMMADAGCDQRDIQAILGHASSRMTEHYTKGADRRRRAQRAIDTLEQAENIDCQTEVSNTTGEPIANTPKGVVSQ